MMFGGGQSRLLNQESLKARSVSSTLARRRDTSACGMLGSSGENCTRTVVGTVDPCSLCSSTTSTPCAAMAA